MNRFIYEGVQCPACNRTLEENDDIVVCPDCGTPYHRECYKRVGKCLFEEKHNEYFESYKLCPFCKSVISMGASTCPMCKKSLVDDAREDVSNSSKHNTSGDTSNSKTDKFESFLNERIKRVEQTSSYKQAENSQESNLCDFATDKEVSDYIGGGNVYYYISVFSRIKNLRLSRFNFFAFLLSGIWFLYRKQYKIGAIITVVMLLLTVADAVVESIVMSSMSGLFSQAGIDMSSSSFTFEDISRLSSLVNTLPRSEQLLFFMPTLIFGIKLIIMLFCGLKGNMIYYNRCNNFFISIKDDTSKASRTEKIKRHGGINFGIAVSVYVSYWLVKFFLPNIF